MTIQQALNQATRELKNKKIKTASLDAEVLFSFIVKKPKEFLYTHPETNLTKTQIKKFKSLVSRRLKGEPVAYLRNCKEFYGLDFYVDKRVLIPRPETELLVDEVIKQITYSKWHIANRKLAIADIGTGSGAIIVTLAKILPAICHMLYAISYYATDISKSALQVAKINAKKHQVKIKFFCGDLLDPLKNQKNDIIVANLPYLEDNYQVRLDQRQITSLKFEPKKALAAGKYGLAAYQRLFQQINQLKNQPRWLISEIPHLYLNQTKKLVRKYFPQTTPIIKKDLAGLNRVLLIKF